MPFQRPPVDPTVTDHSDALDKLVVRKHREVCLGFAVSAVVTFGLQMLVFGLAFEGVTWVPAYVALTAVIYAVGQGIRATQIHLQRTVLLDVGIPQILGMVLGTLATPFALMAMKPESVPL